MNRQSQIDDAIAHTAPVRIAGLDFHLLASSDYHCDSKQSVGLHRHPWFSLILTCCGTTRHRFPHGDLEIKTNDLLFIPPGVLHSWISQDLPLRMRGVIFEIRSPESDIRLPLAAIEESITQSSFCFSLPDDILAGVIIELFDRLESSAPMFLESIQALLHRFVVTALQQTIGAVVESFRVLPKGPLSTNAERTVARVKSHIQANLDQKLTREEVAHHIHLSPRHLSRIFRSETGESVGSFICRCKVQKAVDLLQQSELSIKEIAYAVGYREIASFYRMIHRELGAPPAEFRRQAGDAK